MQTISPDALVGCSNFPCAAWWLSAYPASLLPVFQDSQCLFGLSSACEDAEGRALPVRDLAFCYWRLSSGLAGAFLNLRIMLARNTFLLLHRNGPVAAHPLLKRQLHASGSGSRHLTVDPRIWQWIHASGCGSTHLAVDQRIWQWIHVSGCGSMLVALRGRRAASACLAKKSSVAAATASFLLGRRLGVDTKKTSTTFMTWSIGLVGAVWWVLPATFVTVAHHPTEEHGATTARGTFLGNLPSVPTPCIPPAPQSPSEY